MPTTSHLPNVVADYQADPSGTHDSSAAFAVAAADIRASGADMTVPRRTEPTSSAKDMAAGDTAVVDIDRAPGPAPCP